MSAGGGHTADSDRTADAQAVVDLVCDLLDEAHATHRETVDALAIVARLEAAANRAADAERERDEAIAHDRQPYPTAWAYERACKALRAAEAERDAAHAENDLLQRQVSSMDTNAVKLMSEAMAERDAAHAALRETYVLIRCGDPDNALHALDAFLLKAGVHPDFPARAVLGGPEETKNLGEQGS